MLFVAIFSYEFVVSRINIEMIDIKESKSKTIVNIVELKATSRVNCDEKKNV